MSTFARNIMGYQAAASGSLGAFFRNRGFSGIVANGVGDYSLTLSEPCDLDNFNIQLAAIATVNLRCIAEKVSSTVIRIRFATALGVATDSAWTLRVLQIGPN